MVTLLSSNVSTCAIVNCKRVSRALCHCCQQNLCIIHLNEHNDLLNSQLNPLTDEINTLGERLKTLNIQDIVGDCRQKLEQWRQDCHKKIDQFFEEKLQEIDLLVAKKLDGQRERYYSYTIKEWLNSFMTKRRLNKISIH